MAVRRRPYRHFLDQAVLLRGGEGIPDQYAGTCSTCPTARIWKRTVPGAQDGRIGKLTGGIAHDFNNLSRRCSAGSE
jgi:hypothetical protein